MPRGNIASFPSYQTKLTFLAASILKRSLEKSFLLVWRTWIETVASEEQFFGSNHSRWRTRQNIHSMLTGNQNTKSSNAFSRINTFWVNSSYPSYLWPYYQTPLRYYNSERFAKVINLLTVSTTCAVVIFSRVKASCVTSAVSLWLLTWSVNKVVILLVVCQLSSDVIGYEDSLNRRKDTWTEDLRVDARWTPW